MIDYTETVRDVKAIVRQERDAARRESMMANIEAMEREHRSMREELITLRIQAANIVTIDIAKKIAEDATKVLTERVEWHTWLLRVVILATAVEMVAGVIVGFVIHGLKQ